MSRKLIEIYKGHPLFLTDTFDYANESNYIGIAVKAGDISKKSDRYDFIARNVEGAKAMVDRIEGGFIQLTEKERNDWVVKPNMKAKWGFTRRGILGIYKAYQKADERRKVGYLERLTDANFHCEAEYIENGNLEGLKEYIKWMPN